MRVWIVGGLVVFAAAVGVVAYVGWTSIDDLEAEVAALTLRVSQLETRSNATLSIVELRVDPLDSRVDRLDGQLSDLQFQVSQLEGGTQVGTTVAELDERIGSLDAELAFLDGSLASLRACLNTALTTNSEFITITC
jgi:hypothetical protein